MEFTDHGMGVFQTHVTRHGDHRGSVTETLRMGELSMALGYTHEWAQGNLSINHAGVFRGIHFSLAPEGQAKYVTCVQGMIYDYAVDLRKNSPTFGAVAVVPLLVGESLYIPVGFGHGFVTVEEQTVVSYLLSSVFHPDLERTVAPGDLFAPMTKALAHGILTGLKTSPRDAEAQTLGEYVESGGELPRYTDTANDKE